MGQFHNISWVWSRPAPHSPVLTHCFPELGFRCDHKSIKQMIPQKINLLKQETKANHSPKSASWSISMCPYWIGSPAEEVVAHPFLARSAITPTQCDLTLPANGFLWRGKKFRFLPTCCGFPREAGVRVPILLKLPARAPLLPTGEDLSS